MGQQTTGPWSASDIKLARLAARIRGDYKSIAGILEEAASDIAACVYPGGHPNAAPLLENLRQTLSAIRRLRDSEQPDLAVTAAIERALNELYRDLGELRDTVAGGTEIKAQRP